MAWTKDNGKQAKLAAEIALLAGSEAQVQAERASLGADYIDEKKPLIDEFTGEQTNLQAQLDALVVDGDSSPEAAQARVGTDATAYATLKARLDSEQNKVTAQLADTSKELEFEKNKPLLKNGRLVLPSDFPKIGFEITRLGKRNFKHNATPYKQHDWSMATEVFISDVTATGDGLSYLSPIYLALFVTNYKNGVYGSQKNFILTIQTNVYTRSDIFSLDAVDANFFIRSGSLNNFTWLGRLKRPSRSTETSAWVSDGGVFKTTQVTNHSIIDIVNTVDVDMFGMPKLYKQVSTLAACVAEIGTYYQNGAAVYCNPLDNINNCNLLLSTGLVRTSGWLGKTLIFSNIGFLASTYTFTLSSLAQKMYLFKCKFQRSLQDAFAVTGIYQTFLFDCVASYASKDGYNYHTTDINSLGVEINCFSYGNGLVKMAGGNTTQHSNNGSTAHDGMYMLRVGCKYWDCEGPIVADVMNCFSISIGIEANNILPTTSGVKTAFQFYDNEDTTEATARPKYVIECLGNGASVGFGITGTAKTYVTDFEGNSNFEGAIKQTDWAVMV